MEDLLWHRLWLSPVPLALQTLDVGLILLWEGGAWFQQGYCIKWKQCTLGCWNKAEWHATSPGAGAACDVAT